MPNLPDNTGPNLVQAFHPITVEIGHHRFKTERVDAVLHKTIEGENLDLLLNGLTPDEQNLFYELVGQLRESGDLDLDDLWKVDYTRRPPTMEEFLEEDYWLAGIARKSDESEGVFPAWKEILCRDFNLDSRLHNTVITGSLGVGKCLRVGTKVMMHDGSIRRVEQVKVGDKLMGDDSTPRTVINTVSGHEDLYEIRGDGAVEWACTGDHVLCLKSPDGEIAEITVKNYLVRLDEFVGWTMYRVGVDLEVSLACGKKVIGHLSPSDKEYAFVVRPIGPGNYYGFELDGNRRFLLSDFTVTHNSFVTALIFAYRLAQACLLRNPQAFLGLSKGSMVYYVMLSVTRAQVTETIFGDILNLMGNCPFFLEECGYSPKKKYAGMNVPLGRNIFLTAGSQSQHIVGRNTLGVAMDEGNWRREKNPNKSAYKLFDEVRTRLKNRFQKVAGYLPAISILASSARDESSFTEQVIKDIEAINNPSVEKVYRLAAFEVKRHKLVLSKRWFKVAYGVRNQDPRVLGGWFDEAGNLEAGSVAEEVPKGSQIRMVPYDYIDSFKRNVTTALQSICGVSTGGSFRLFGNMADFERAALNAEQVKLENPCLVQSISLSVEDDKQIWDFLDHRKLVARRAGTFNPLRDPDRLRFAHIDLATATQAGVSICHTADTRNISGLYDRNTGKAFSEFRPVIEYDLVLSIVAGAAKPISFEKIQNLFFWLRDRCGYRFGTITADTYQSTGLLQLLESRGFVAKVLSLDRTKEPYYSWREAFIEGRIRLFKHSILWNESEHLVDGAEKIDHQENTSKDVSDSAAGAYFGAFKGKESGQSNSADPAIHGGSAEPESDDLHGMTPGLVGTQSSAPTVRRFGG